MPTFPPISDTTLVTVSLGVQSVQMPWAKVASSFEHSPYIADRIREDLEKTGISSHEEFGFFLPDDDGKVHLREGA